MRNVVIFVFLLLKIAPMLGEDHHVVLFKNSYPYVSPIRQICKTTQSIVHDDHWDLFFKAYRYRYNDRALIESSFFIESAKTAVIIVHPWAMDDQHGIKTDKGKCSAFFSTPEKNALGNCHMKEKVNPILKKLRGRVKFVGYSLPAGPHDQRKRLYRNFHYNPSHEEKVQAFKEIQALYNNHKIPNCVDNSKTYNNTTSYFRDNPGLQCDGRTNGEGFWNLPIIVNSSIDVEPQDYVIFDGDGYQKLKTELKNRGIKHVLLGGYHTNLCVKLTCVGYDNLSKDFNVVLMGDATLATYPGDEAPADSTKTAIQEASLNCFFTEITPYLE